MLDSYKISKKINETSSSLIYRGVRLKDSVSVIIKTIKQEYPTPHIIHNYQWQYEIIRSLDNPGIIKTYDLLPYKNGLALILEDFAGKSLKFLLDQNPLEIGEFLTIAIEITKSLQIIHAANIIHKDINPSNILFNQDTKELKIIDFGIATQLPKEQKSLQTYKTLEGTLAYISPEQTGRMNRGLDYRSDYYSLGITLYQLLTQQLPFETQEPKSLIHAHLSKIPPSPQQIKPEIPTPVSEIVMKLMAKNAEDRYQSAAGLIHDLENCLNQLNNNGEIQEFELGQKDISSRFIIPDKLYGRESEVKVLLDSFERVSEGNSELMLVAGFSGIGKTAVVNEVHKPITRQKGYFIKGKFDQFNRNIPFSAFVQAFSGLVKQLLAESDEELRQWKTEILAALGNNAQVIIDVIPNLEIILGKQPEVPELSGSAAQNRFNLVFGQFVQVFTKQEHPLVIFLDDLQWADSASLGLLKLLMSESKTNANSLLVLGAYRDNEVFPAHPLMLCLQEIEQQQGNINTITLEPLAESDINCLVADTLLCSNTIATPLSGLIYQKTQGNPFFSTQFLKGLYEDGYINFNREDNCWQCELKQIRELVLTDDVVKFMVGRLQKLPENTQEILKLAACIGNRFDLDTLAIICEKSEVEVTNDLWSALQVGLVVPESQIYRLYAGNEIENTSEDSVIEYRFLHDRVQQAAYAFIPSDSIAAFHLKIGESFLKNLSEVEVTERALDIVRHFNVCIPLLVNSEQKTQVIELNLIAAYKAHKSTAYSAAITYLNAGIELLSEDSWNKQRDLTFSLYNKSAEAALLAGEFEIARQKISTIIQQSHHVLESIKAHEIKISLFQAQHQQIQSLEIAISVLRKLNIDIPEYPTEADIQKEIAEVDIVMGTRNISDIVNLPTADNSEIEAAMRILASIVAPTYQIRPLLFQLTAIRQFKLSVLSGLMPETPLACTLYGTVITGNLSDVDRGYQLGQLGIDLLDRPESEPVKTITQHLFHNLIRCYTDPASREGLK